MNFPNCLVPARMWPRRTRSEERSPHYFPAWRLANADWCPRQCTLRCKRHRSPEQDARHARSSKALMQAFVPAESLVSCMRITGTSPRAASTLSESSLPRRHRPAPRPLKIAHRCLRSATVLQFAAGKAIDGAGTCAASTLFIVYNDQVLHQR